MSNIPSINKNQQLTTHLSLNPVQKALQPKKQKKVWKETYSLIGINSPQIIENPKRHKIFKLKFTYKDEQSGKKHSHVIYFGQKNDYIFTGNKEQRVKKILKMKNLDNPFHSDYWSAHLANKYSTLKQGLEMFTQYFIQNNNKTLQKKQLEILNKTLIK